MSIIFDNDILIHHIAAPGLPGDGFTAPEAATLRNDIDTLLGRPVITELDDIPDVDAAAPTDGDTLVYNASTEQWESVAPVGSVRVLDNGTEEVPNATSLDFGQGINITPVSSSYAVASVAFGGTGDGGSAAKWDHTHNLPQTGRTPIVPQAYMSGGTRTLATTSIVIANGQSVKVDARVRLQVRGGDPGASYYTLNLGIDGNTRSTGSGVNGLWCVQGVPKETEISHGQTIVGTGVAIVISASISWGSGGGFYTDAGELEVRATFQR